MYYLIANATFGVELRVVGLPQVGLFLGIYFTEIRATFFVVIILAVPLPFLLLFYKITHSVFAGCLSIFLGKVFIHLNMTFVSVAAGLVFPPSYNWKLT